MSSFLTMNANSNTGNYLDPKFPPPCEDYAAMAAVQNNYDYYSAQTHHQIPYYGQPHQNSNLQQSQQQLPPGVGVGLHNHHQHLGPANFPHAAPSVTSAHGNHQHGNAAMHTVYNSAASVAMGATSQHHGNAAMQHSHHHMYPSGGVVRDYGGLYGQHNAPANYYPMVEDPASSPSVLNNSSGGPLHQQHSNNPMLSSMIQSNTSNAPSATKSPSPVLSNHGGGPQTPLSLLGQSVYNNNGEDGVVVGSSLLPSNSGGGGGNHGNNNNGVSSGGELSGEESCASNTNMPGSEGMDSDNSMEDDEDDDAHPVIFPWMKKIHVAGAGKMLRGRWILFPFGMRFLVR